MVATAIKDIIFRDFAIIIENQALNKNVSHLHNDLNSELHENGSLHETFYTFFAIDGNLKNF